MANLGFIGASNAAYYSFPATSYTGQAAQTAGVIDKPVWIRAKFKTPASYPATSSKCTVLGDDSGNTNIAIDMQSRRLWCYFGTTVLISRRPLPMNTVVDVIMQLETQLNPQGVGGSLRVYVVDARGGVQRFSGTSALGGLAAVTGTGMRVGRTGTFSSTWFNGTIYEVTKGQGNLTLAQMSALGLGSDPVADLSLTCDYHFPFATAASTISDTSGNGATATLVGSASSGTAVSYAGSSIGVDDLQIARQAAPGGVGTQQIINLAGGTPYAVSGAIVGTAAGLDGQWVEATVQQTVSAAVSTGSTVTLWDTTGVGPGLTVSGTGIAAGTKVLSVVKNGAVLLDTALSGSVALNSMLTFGDVTNVIVSWTAMASVSIASGRWTAIAPPLPVGGKRVLQVRKSDATSVIGQAQAATCAGIVVALNGQSNQFQWTFTQSPSPVLTVQNVTELRYNNYLDPSGNGMIAYANMIGTMFPNMNIVLINGSVSSSGLVTASSTGLWSDTVSSNSPWVYFTQQLSYAGGDYMYRVFVQGENELGNTITLGAWKAAYVAMLAREWAITGRSSKTLIDAVALVGPSTVSAATDATAVALRKENETVARINSPARLCQDHSDFHLAFGNLHCDTPHYQVLAAAQIQTLQFFMGMGGGRGIGPHFIRWKFNGNQVSLWVAHENGKALVKRAASQAATGFMVKDNAGIIAVTADRIVGGNRVDLTLSRAAGPGRMVGYLQQKGMGPTTTLGTNPITTASGTATVTLAWTAHGLSVGHWFAIDNYTAVGGYLAGSNTGSGAVLSSEWQVASVVDANTITFTALTNATSTATGGGAAVTARPSNFFYDDSTNVAAGGLPVRPLIMSAARSRPLSVAA